MTFVHVVPARRMPVAMQTLTYSVPDDMPVREGQLVEVPLRGRAIIGVIWRCDVPSTQHPIQSVTRILTQVPVVTPWLRLFLTQAAESSFCSLSDLVYATLPKLSAARLQKHLTVDQGVSLPPLQHNKKTFRFTTRSEGLQWITNNTDKQLSLIIAPTLSDIQDIAAAFQAMGTTVTTVTGEITPTALAKLFRDLMLGKSQILVGTQRALFLPFPITPNLLVDQVEHHAHKTQAQHPRLDTRVLLARSGVPYSVTSAAASVQFAVQPIASPQNIVQQRQLVSLNREKGFSWLADETREEIDTVTKNGGKVICIVPRTGYASSFTCRQCGYAPACPNCRHAASLIRGEREALHCKHCNHTIPALTSCPKCNGVTWAYHGLGVDRLREYMSEQWPELTIAASVRRDVPADIAIDTYSGYAELPHITGVELIVVVIGDVMLNVPDFSTSERTWQYLARLQSFAEGRKVIVQSFQPEQRFWQRWVHGDEVAWFSEEQSSRTSLRLPPSTLQWVVRYRGDRKIFDQTLQKLNQRFTQALHCSVLPTDKRRLTNTGLITFTDATLSTNEDWLTIFPTPWQVDTCPQSWLD